jgi:hypothetical protein
MLGAPENFFLSGPEPLLGTPIYRYVIDALQARLPNLEYILKVLTTIPLLNVYVERFFL